MRTSRFLASVLLILATKTDTTHTEPPLTFQVTPATAEHELTGPHVLAAGVGDVIVRVRGGATCTGTPITGTTFVVTAAHCVLVGDHVAPSRTVLRDGVVYTAVSVLVNLEYRDSREPRLDAAVLVMDQVIRGPSATVGDVFPAHGRVTLAGIQPLDTDGSLLRGTRYDNLPRPQATDGGVVKIETAAAGCVHLVSELEITDTRVNVPCGLIPGASGGGLFVNNNGEMILVGIISTVAKDLTFNGVVPLAALHELLDNPEQYAHEMAGATIPKREPAPLSMDAQLQDLANRGLIPDSTPGARTRTAVDRRPAAEPREPRPIPDSSPALEPAPLSMDAQLQDLANRGLIPDSTPGAGTGTAVDGSAAAGPHELGPDSSQFPSDRPSRDGTGAVRANDSRLNEAR